MSGKILISQLFVFLFLCPCLCAAGQLSAAGSKSGKAQQNAGNQQKKADVNHRVAAIICCGRDCHEGENDPDRADSVLREAIALAETTYDNALILQAYNAYLECMDQGPYTGKRPEMVPRVEELAGQVHEDSLLWRTFLNLADVYRSRYMHERALECSYNSLNYAESSSGTGMKIKSLISIGKCQEGKNQLMEAFRSYLNALTLAETSGDPLLLKDVYKALSRFYHLSRNFNKAIEYKLKEEEVVSGLQDADSLSRMWIQYDLEEISYNSRQRVNEANITKLLRFSDRPDRQRLRFFTISLYRAYLINSDQPGKLRDLYKLRFPGELEKLARADTSMFLRVKALICEYEGKADSAMMYFREAERSLAKETNKTMKANFYIRYGQFLNRRKQSREALEMFHQAYGYASGSGYWTYAIQSCEELEQAYLSLGDYQNAHEYTRNQLMLKDSLANIARRDELLLMEIDNASRIRQEIMERERTETERRYNLQYMAITIITVVVFIMLMMLASLRVPRWSIHLLGFVSFILLFEFIILILDQWIHHITHGEPWKILLIKVGVIAILMPLHHYAERRVIRYVLTAKGVRLSWQAFRKFLRELYHSGEAHAGEDHK